MCATGDIVGRVELYSGNVRRGARHSRARMRTLPARAPAPTPAPPCKQERTGISLSLSLFLSTSSSSRFERRRMIGSGGARPMARLGACTPRAYLFAVHRTQSTSQWSLATASRSMHCDDNNNNHRSNGDEARVALQATLAPSPAALNALTRVSEAVPPLQCATTL